MFKSIHLDFIVEVTNVADNCLVLHLSHVIDANDVDITCCSNKNITLCTSLFHGYNFESFHCSLQGADRIYFRNQYTGTV